MFVIPKTGLAGAAKDRSGLKSDGNVLIDMQLSR
jgi:hypothetical protein